MRNPQQILKDISLDLDFYNPYEPDETDPRYGLWPEMATLLISMIQDEFREEEMKTLPDADDRANELAKESHE